MRFPRLSRLVPSRLLIVACAFAVPGSGLPASAAPTGNPAFTDPAQADADFRVQGEYAGDLEIDGHSVPIGVHVIALGDGKFDFVAYPGGLPGAGWNASDRIRGTGAREGDGDTAVVKLEAVDKDGLTRKGRIENGVLHALSDVDSALGSLARVDRSSPTLGQKPPEGAIVIFAGGDDTDTSRLVDGRVSPDGLLMEGVTTKDDFGDARWHIEFRLPYQPKDRGQARGNSGAYLQGCYEVQMLDSFGLDGKDNECGGIYKAAAPRVNACLPPLSWQTYDIDFTAPRFDGEKKTANARMTVRHNGILIHDDQEIPAFTPGGPRKQEGPKGPLFLQNHGNPVRYRTIWVLPKS
jgi:hypothetical protein